MDITVDKVQQIVHWYIPVTRMSATILDVSIVFSTTKNLHSSSVHFLFKKNKICKYGCCIHKIRVT